REGDERQEIDSKDSDLDRPVVRNQRIRCEVRDYADCSNDPGVRRSAQQGVAASAEQQPVKENHVDHVEGPDSRAAVRSILLTLSDDAKFVNTLRRRTAVLIAKGN